MSAPLAPNLLEPVTPKPLSTADALRDILSRLPRRIGTWFRVGVILAATGVTQRALAANTERRYLLLQAYSGNAASIWFDISSAAENGPFALELVPGQSLVFESDFVPTGEVWVNGTAGDKMMLREGFYSQLTDVE